MGRQAGIMLYVLGLVAVVVGVDVPFALGVTDCT
jgi:hypothetical protein